MTNKTNISTKVLWPSLLLVAMIFTTGCGLQPSQPAVAVDPPVISALKVSDPTPQEPGAEVGISVDVSSTGDVKPAYTWTVDDGEIVRGQGSLAITYRAPDKPGTYNVRLTIEWNGQTVEKVASIKVKEAATATPTPPPPTDTPTPKPTSTPTEVTEVSDGDGDAVVSILVTYLREQPEPSAKARETLQKGDSVDLLAVNQDKTWVQARVYDHVGWVSVDDLKLNISLDELAVEEIAAIPTPTPQPTSTPLPTHTSVPPPPTNTPKPACPYQADTDAATIANIIQAEGEAANKEDISIIRAIFAPDALIRYERDGTEWHDPVERYLGLFASSEIVNSIHFDIQPIGEGITADTAWFISGSSGTWTPNGGEPYNFYNEPGKDSWVLKKNHLGCWIIVEFRFH